MHPKIVLHLVVFAFFLLLHAEAQRDTFALVTKMTKVSIVYDSDAPKLDSIAAHLLAEDIERVTSFKPAVITDLSGATGNVIVIGAAASALVQRVAGQSAVVAGLRGKWECFALTVVDKPSTAISKALVIAGSDARGTAYGVFSLSEKIGVSPWYWWADVPAKRRENLVVEQPDFISAPPSVRYRGIFINDEDWGLRPWASNTYEPEVGNIGPGTYARVFELLLRLKANFIWPAMHPGTKAFYSVAGNKEMAALYDIVIGASHAEPMLRNNVGEWNEKTMGDFNYLTNKAKVDQYWEDRVKELDTSEVVYTMGMRGVHDGQMEGVRSAKEAVPLLEQIVTDQRKLLQKYTHKDIAAILQVFTPYKEVLGFYDSGLKVPDDITLVWPDDNYGYIQRLSDDAERKRPGRAGVYYHVSYWGRPHDYLWLSSTHPALIREEMMKAYETGADRVWVLNVGDIKPAEYEMQLFLDMAYDVTPFRESSYSKTHLLHWNQRIFGPYGGIITDFLWNVYNLAFERRPEFMGWSQTEPTTTTSYTSYNHFSYGDEAQRRIDKYDGLETAVAMLRQMIPRAEAGAFYELVYYPVVGAAEMNKKFLYRDKAYLYARQERISVYDYALESKAAYDRIAKETDYYNDSLLQGKWRGMMSMHPRDLPVFQPPVLPAIAIPKNKQWAISPEGCDSTGAGELVLPEFTRGLKRRYFIDVFSCDSARVRWKALASAGWIRLSDRQGTLSPKRDSNQLRLWVDVDWSKAPAGERLRGSITFSGAGSRFKVDVHAFRPDESQLKGFHGSVETNGYLSLYARHYSGLVNQSSFPWQRIEGLGYTGAAMESAISPLPAAPVDPAAIKGTASRLTYAFFTFNKAPADNKAPAKVVFYAVPTLPLNRKYGMRCAFCIDDGPLQVFDFSANSTARTAEWKQNVLSNTAIRSLPGPILGPGKHTLTIFALDPGVVLDRIVIDLGGFRPAYGVVEETRI